MTAQEIGDLPVAGMTYRMLMVMELAKSATQTGLSSTAHGVALYAVNATDSILHELARVR